MLYLTEDCNLRCTYCFVDKKPRRMTSEVARKAVEFFLHRNISGAEWQIGITFFGGEPFIELDRMEEVVAIAREPRQDTYKKIRFSATTNATIATPRVERIIKDSNMSLLISMDGGHGASSYRPFVSGKSSYEHVAKNLPKLVSWSGDAYVRMTFHPGALDLVGNVRHALELGAPAVALCPVVEARWAGHEEALEEAYQALAEWYIEEARRGRILPLEITHIMLRQYHAYRHGAPRTPRPCGVGTYLLGVDPEGHVMPCHRFLYRPQDWLGTVDSPKLSEKRQKYVHLSSRDILGCDVCVAEPVCGGGCRAVVVNAGIDLTQAHPSFCLVTRAHARAAIRIYDTLSKEENTAFLHSLHSESAHDGALAELASS